MRPEDRRGLAAEDWALVLLMGVAAVVATLLLAISSWFASSAGLELVDRSARAAARPQSERERQAEARRRRLDSKLRIGFGSPAEEARLARLRQRAERALERGEHRQANALLEELLSVAPDDAAALALMGRVLLARELPGQALQVVGRAIRANPADMRARRVRARVLVALDRPEEALLDLDRILLHRPGELEARLLRAELRERRGQPHKALTDWQRAMAASQEPAQRARCKARIDELVSGILSGGEEKR